jgi:hypothetical protein
VANWQTTNHRDDAGRPVARRRRCARRKGALLSAEMLIVFPAVVILLYGIVEFSFLLSANSQLASASQTGARVGTLPGAMPTHVETAVRDTLDPSFKDEVSVTFTPGLVSGDEVTVEVRLEMTKAAPDLLTIFGFDLSGRFLEARSVMRKE